MAVDRLSVTVPSELGVAVRGLAKARGQTVSTLVAGAIAHEVRLAALDLALAVAERRHGPVPEELVAREEAGRGDEADSTSEADSAVMTGSAPGSRPRVGSDCISRRALR